MAMRESGRQLKDAIEKIVSAAAEGGYITGGDQSRIAIAVENFVRKNFCLRYPGSKAPVVRDLPARVERTILGFSRDVMILDEVVKPLCSQLAEWINANYQKVPGRPWRGLGRGFKP